MKINNIDLYCFSPDTVSPRFVANMSFRDPGSHKSYKITGLSGLDAEEISSKFYGYTYMTNRKSYTMSQNKRFVTMEIELLPNYQNGESVSALRDNIYRAIASSRTGDIYLLFKFDTSVIAHVSGHFSKMESDLLTDHPKVTITIDCPDPMLKSVDEIIIDVDEFTNESFTLTDEISTAHHGFTFGVTFTGPCTNFTIAEPMTYDWKFEIIPRLITPEYDGFIVGDQLIFSSIPGSRELQVIRDGVYYHIVDKISPGAFWPIVFPGTNNYDVQGENFEWSWMRYYHTYWGV